MVPSHVAPHASDTDPLIGRIIDGKYAIEGVIGEGGMGKVYRGRNTRTDGPVAIKTLLPGLIDDESLVARFEIEAKSASALKHPNTIRIYDFGREDTCLFMVMELLDGEPFEKLISTAGRIDPPRALHIMKQVCRSLAEAHASGLVHRDMKPDNIFLNRVGDEPDHVKVLDFGVAKLKQKSPGQATLTQAGMIFGTPRYMSPEQARAAEIDGRSDIYALGVILYEALTGVPPFDGRDPVSILVKHVNEPFPPFAELVPDLGAMPDLEAICRRCMEKEPDARFDDVATLLNALEAAEARYGRYGTDRAFASPAVTQAFPSEDGPGTPAPTSLDQKAFDKLGLTKSGKTGEDLALNASRYTMGADLSPKTPSPAAPAVKDGKPSVALVGVAAVVVVGALAAVLFGGGGERASESSGEVSEPADPAEAEAEDGQLSAEQLVAVLGSIGQASTATALAVQSADNTTHRWVRHIEVRVTPESADADVLVDGREAVYGVNTPIPFVVDPALESAEFELRVEAEGYRAAVERVDIATQQGPVEIRLRRRSTSSGSARPAPPRPRPAADPPQPAGGLADPFGD